jgi:tRNA threonylcarbamoyladenosine biosynthesis protein TsaB
MKIIGIESSGLVAGVALWEDGVLLGESMTNCKKTHSQTLLPQLERMLAEAGVKPAEADAIAVASGPGSFTGLRIGSATAKGLGLAIGKPLVEVPTLEGLAYNLWGAEGIVCPMMDARRSQVYTGAYAFPRGADGSITLETVIPGSAIAAAEAAERLNALGRPVILLGDGVDVSRELLESILTVPHTYAPAHMNRQRAGSIAALGAIYLAEGRGISPDDHAPDYMRKSQAEREGPGHFEV